MALQKLVQAVTQTPCHMGPEVWTVCDVSTADVDIVWHLGEVQDEKQQVLH